MLYRIDYIDTLGKPRINSFKVKNEAKKRIEFLESQGILIVSTSWDYVPAWRREAGEKSELVDLKTG